MIREKTFLDTFWMCFPKKYIVDHLLPETNKHLLKKMTLQEIYVVLGYQFFVACFDGVTDRRLWWSSEPVSKFIGAPFRLTEYMSGKRFEQIVAALRYTNKEPSHLKHYICRSFPRHVAASTGVERPLRRGV